MNQFIDQENKTKQCGRCLKPKPFTDFNRTMLGGLALRCKLCQSRLAEVKRKEVKLKLFPMFYARCDKCRWIYKKSSPRVSATKCECV